MTEANGDYTSFVYDNVYQLADEYKRTSGEADIYRVTYVYDAVGNRTDMTKDGTRTTYSYDAANKMTEFTTGGNRTTFSYDGNGNQTARTVPGVNITTYSYNYENKMTGITYPDSSLNTFSYDGDGKRLQKQDSSGTLRLVYDHQGPTGLYDLVKETDGSNNLVAFYTQGPTLISQRRGGNTYWYHDDALGSVNAITGSDETTTSTYKYYAFGELLAATGTLTNPFKYVGGLGYYTDPDSGLLLLRARYYWPSVGRFVSRDVVYVGRAVYHYARSRPTRLLDPSGYQPIWGQPGIISPACPPGYTDLGVFDVRFRMPSQAECLMELGEWELTSWGSQSEPLSNIGEGPPPEGFLGKISCGWRRTVYLRFEVNVEVKEGHKCQKVWWEWSWCPLGWVPKYDTQFPYRTFTLRVEDKYTVGTDRRPTQMIKWFTYAEEPLQKAKQICEQNPPLSLPAPPLGSFPDVWLPGGTRCRPVSGAE